MSDTHYQIENICIATKYLNESCVDLVIHYVDWVSPFLLEYYQALKAPIYNVSGNNDGIIFQNFEFAN